jgi:glycosyltransferase involved in cell wall biosynthesis
MKITMIGCPFKTSFGLYISSLRDAIERKTGNRVQWVASNCGCGDPIEVGRDFQVHDCDYFAMPIPADFRSGTLWKRRARGFVRNAFLYCRARRYASLSGNAEIVHFQQILNAYGSRAVFQWLRRPSNATRIVTVHEMDREQVEFPETNTTYNRADGIIVHCEEMRQRLLGLGVQEDKMHTVLHGTDMPSELDDGLRNGIVFYGGHKLLSGKGFETVIKALSILEQRMRSNTPILKIHGHYGYTTPEEAIRLSSQYGVAGRIAWLNQLSQPDAIALYQCSLLCVLPYTGSFGGYAASLAAACQLPVIGTRRAGLPDHLGDSGIWIDEDSPQQLADRISALLGNPEMRREIGARLLKRAKSFLSWDAVADRTLQVYEPSMRNRAVPA